MESNQNLIRANKQPACNTRKLMARSLSGSCHHGSAHSRAETLQNATRDAHPGPQTVAPRAVVHSSDSILESPGEFPNLMPWLPLDRVGAGPTMFADALKVLLATASGQVSSPWLLSQLTAFPLRGRMPTAEATNEQIDEWWLSF